MRKIVAGSALTLLLFSTACADPSDPEGPDLLHALDAADVAADGAREHLEMMRTPGVPGLAFRGVIFPAILGNRPDCPSPLGVFECPPAERDGVTYERSITYLDASGSPQDAYDDATTASVHLLFTTAGTIANPRFEATRQHSLDLTLSGLVGNETEGIWNGSGEGFSERSRHLQGGARSYRVSTVSVVKDVRVPHPRTEDGWPLSGSIETRIDMTPLEGGGDARTVEATMTFDGTQMATLTVAGETFEVDLAARGKGPRHRDGPPGFGR